MGVRRGGRWLLRPVAFGIAGGVVGLAGPPGVGKSTLLATFATLRRPSSGALEILGYDTGSTPDLRAARARIGYLPGCFSWAENMTAGEFVAYAAYYKRVQASAARSVLKRLDLADAAATELALLPPDARLRAGLAAACVHEPDLVLLDDPFAGLTAASAAELVPVVRALAPSVVLTSGDTPPLMGWCDRLFTLARGKLTELPPGAPVHAPRAPRPFREGPGEARPAARRARPGDRRGDRASARPK
ncbi:ATP-binding cassette domain-containing protein, partial [Actinomadura yumaensis]|uniref:ATP-binding cassette domain-containing protein n=1 Tax=Actinomadura yumaensis TaxID=111807 RepID=UPI0036718203